MTLDVTPGRTRLRATYLWVSYMAWVGFFWLGWSGAGLVCVAATGLLRRVWAAQPVRVRVDTTALTRVWITPVAVAFTSEGTSTWLYRDEVGPAQWARLSCQLKLHAPAQAEGLSLSS